MSNASECKLLRVQVAGLFPFMFHTRGCSRSGNCRLFRYEDTYGGCLNAGEVTLNSTRRSSRVLVQGCYQVLQLYSNLLLAWFFSQMQTVTGPLVLKKSRVLVKETLVSISKMGGTVFKPVMFWISCHIHGSVGNDVSPTVSADVWALLP